MILLLAEFYGSGGTRTYVRQLLDFYYSQEIEVTLIGMQSEPDTELRQVLEDRGMSYISYSNVLNAGHLRSGAKVVVSPKVWSYKFMRSERSAFRGYIAKSGAVGIVVSAGTPGIFAGAAGASSKNLYILHTYPHGKRQQLFGRLVMRKFFRQVRNFVAVSQFEKKEMLRLWRLPISKSKITVIPNSAGPILPPQKRPSGNKYQVITASWVESYKNPELWLKVAKSVTTKLGQEHVRFIWLGGGSLLGRFQRETGNYLHHVDAEFLGHVDDVEQYYQSADIYLQVSSTENMSLSVIDALRHGVPAVVTDVGGLPEIVEHGKSGLVVPSAPSEVIAESVVRILASETEWSRLSRAGQERYAEFFSPEIWKQEMRSLHLAIFNGNSQYE